MTFRLFFLSFLSFFLLFLFCFVLNSGLYNYSYTLHSPDLCSYFSVSDRLTYFCVLSWYTTVVIKWSLLYSSNFHVSVFYMIHLHLLSFLSYRYNYRLFHSLVSLFTVSLNLSYFILTAKNLYCIQLLGFLRFWLF